MKIKKGYNEKKLKIKVNKSSNRIAELWIEFDCNPKKETLSYITLNELLDLKEEIQKTINEIIKE